EIQAVPSTAHGMLKFPVDGGVVTIRSTISTPNECTTITATSKDSMKKIEGGQENLKVAIHHDFPDQEVALGGTLSIEGWTTLYALLKRNLDIFAWQPSDMTRVPRQTAEHRLNIRDGYLLVRQKKRVQAPERAKAIQAKVQKLVKAGIMREVYYHDWLSNPIMVKKHDAAGESYKGYHQIQMTEEDEEKTAFHTPHGVGRNLEVYVDDLVIKSHTEAELLRDIEETFHTLRKINMKLNPKKCTFRAVEGMFLGYMIGPEGIKPCPEKIEVVLQLPSLRTVKEVQSLNGKLAGLNRSGASFQTTEIAYIRTPHVGGTKAKGKANNVLIRLPRSGWRCLDDRKGLNLDASLFSMDISKGQILADFLVETPEEASFTASNNEAEYEALLAGLRIAAQMGVRNIRVLVKVLQEKSIQEQEVAAVVEEEGPTWITPITKYLKDRVLLDDKKEASKLRIKARQYELMNGILYRRLFLRPWLRCVGSLQADYVIREIHERSCSMHAGPRSVVAKAMRSGYYWPNMHKDARDMILKCKDC
ncbi:reverse transcriptase domain-containing protein, partial [Tanacetum coccineum]